MHLGQARGLVIGLVQPGVAQVEVVDVVVAMVNMQRDESSCQVHRLWSCGVGWS